MCDQSRPDRLLPAKPSQVCTLAVKQHCFLFLCQFPDRTPTEIARELCLNKGHVSVATDGLCKKAYLLASRDGKDRRIVHYTVTDEGMTVNREILKIKDEVNEYLFGGLSEKELNTLCAITEKLIGKFDELSERCEQAH